MTCQRFKNSHKDPFEVTIIAEYLTDICVWLKLNCGKVHDYLGMYLDYSEEVILKLSEIKCLNNLLRGLPKHLGTSEPLLDAEQIFKVRPESEAKYLTEEQS